MTLYYMIWPVTRCAVVQHVARVAIAIPIRYRGGNGGRRIGGEFRGSCIISRGGSTGPGTKWISLKMSSFSI